MSFAETIKTIWLVCVVAAFCTAQGLDALSGRITDSTGAPVSHAVLIITGPDGQSWRVVSDSGGSFRISDLPAESYQLEVESGGRRHHVGSDLEIRTGNQERVEIVLRENARNEDGELAAELRAATSGLQTETAEVARTFGSRTIHSLPVLDRQFQELIPLMPGITPPETEGDRVLDPQQRRIFHVNGQPSYGNSYYQEGTLNTEYFEGNVTRVAPDDAVEGLTVRTANYNAQHGFAGGAWSNTAMQSGLSGIHGSLFEFNNNSWFSTRDPRNRGNHPDPRYNRNRFGGTVGGPIVPDRMFGFLSYEAFLDRGEQLQHATVPTAAMRTGDLGAFGAAIYNPLTGNPTTGVGREQFAGGQIPAALIDPNAQAILNALPEPNLEGLQNNFIGNTRLNQDMHRADARLDHRFSDYTGLFLRYGLTYSDVQRRGLFENLGDGANSGMRNQDAALGLITSSGPDLTSEFRLGYSRYRNEISPVGSSNFNPADFGFPLGIPSISISGFGNLGFPNYYNKAINNSYSGSTNWNWLTGMHNFKIGGELRYISTSGFDPGYFGSRGSFIFCPGPASVPGNVGEALYARSLTSFMTGNPTQAGVSSFVTTPTARQWQGAGHIVDTIRLSQMLHLELGVRYSIFSRVEPRNDSTDLVFDLANNTVTNSFDYDGLDLNNIAPRVGFAFSPMPGVAVRGGYSIQYFALPFSLASFNQRATGVQAGSTGTFGSVDFALPQVPSLPAGTAPNQPFVVGANQGVTPYLHSYNFMIQGDLGAGFLLDLGYLGNLGRQLPYRVPITAPLGSGLAGLPGAAFGRTATVYERGYGLTSQYDSAQVVLTKRFTDGFAMAASYTYSRAFDYGSFDLLNPFSRQANYGPADWDRTHILSISHVWRLPFGQGSRYTTGGWLGEVLGDWEINGILRFATGTPFNVLADSLGAGSPGIGAVTANINGSFDFSDGGFNSSVFSTPLAGFGNLGRNAVRGPDMFKYDLALFRDFTLSERSRFELRAEAYNLTNHTNYAPPVSFVGAPAFGRSLDTLGDAGRRFQLAARIAF